MTKVSLCISAPLNPAIKLFKSQIERKIDEAVEKINELQTNVMEALEKFVNLFNE
jgi:FtsZ-binding cell division protein ZapB